MSTDFNPDGTIPQATNPAQVPIVSSTNTTPIVVTTGTHGYIDGDTVEIEGHKVNTAANGLWQITKLSGTTFSLNGSTGNGVGGATGYCIDYSVNPLIQLPADLVDALDVSSIAPAIEAIGDAVPYLYMRTGKYRLYDSVIIADGGETSTSIGTGWGSSTSITSGTWTKVTGTDATYPNALKAGDILDIELRAFDLSVAGNLFGVGIGAAIAGGSMQILGSFDATGLPSWFLGNTSQSINARYLGGVKAAAMPIAAGDLVLAAMATVVSGPANLVLGQPYWIKVNHYRINS